MDGVLVCTLGMAKIWLFVVVLAACHDHNPQTLDAVVVPDSPAGTRTKVDVLFVIDDSPMMLAKQNALRIRFASFEQALVQRAMSQPLDYHIGAITTDLGAGATTIGACHPDGDGAKLQAFGKAEPQNCGEFNLDGGNYIAYNQRTGGAPETNFTGVTALADAITCITAVGDQGCDYPQPLEAAYRALHDTTILENEGFLRPDAMLAIVWLTDRDDCSVPADTDLFDGTITSYGALRPYRCTNYGVACNGTLAPYASSGGPLTGCTAAPNPPGKLNDVSLYVTYFTEAAIAGGLKDDPRDVVLFAFDAPAEPFDVELQDTTSMLPCSPVSATCAVTLQHSCASANNDDLVGDPAVRLDTVISTAGSHQQSSICDDSYLTGVQDLEQLIATAAATPRT